MKLLALDTSSIACSVALQAGADLFEEHVVEPKAHTRILIPMLQRLLAASGCALHDLDALILGNGPGSFIGLRIAASVAQGLCYGSGLPLVPVLSPTAIAMQCFDSDSSKPVLVAQDARMSEVYLAAYRFDESGLPALEGDIVLQPGAGSQCLIGPQHGKWVAAGDGWKRYPELLEAYRERLCRVSDIQLPRARFLLQPGARALEDGQAVEPMDLIPAYVRQTVAKIPASAGK